LQYEISQKTERATMKNQHRLEVVSWETVVLANQGFCQSQKTVYQEHSKPFEAARKVWESFSQEHATLIEVLETCRRCYELSPFVFNNGNAFVAIANTMAEPLISLFSPVEIQIFKNTTGSFITGQIGKRELMRVMAHFEGRFALVVTLHQKSTETVEPSPAARVAPQQALAVS